MPEKHPAIRIVRPSGTTTCHRETTIGNPSGIPARETPPIAHTATGGSRTSHAATNAQRSCRPEAAGVARPPPIPHHRRLPRGPQPRLTLTVTREIANFRRSPDRPGTPGHTTEHLENIERPFQQRTRYAPNTQNQPRSQKTPPKPDLPHARTRHPLPPHQPAQTPPSRLPGIRLLPPGPHRPRPQTRHRCRPLIGQTPPATAADHPTTDARTRNNPSRSAGDKEPATDPTQGQRHIRCVSGSTP